MYADLEMSDKSSNINKTKTKSSKHDTEEISGSGKTTNAGGSKENYVADINLSKSTKVSGMNNVKHNKFIWAKMREMDVDSKIVH